MRRKFWGISLIGLAVGAGMLAKPSQTVLYSFSGGASSAHAYAGVITDGHGNFFGTTYGGGANGFGSVYELSQTSGNWTETVLYNFAGGDDGAYPYSGVALDSSGNLYGTTYQGGHYASGTVFELSPSGGGWSGGVIYAFLNRMGDGGFPGSGVLVDSQGNLYGTTTSGGNGGGVVYKLSKPDGNWLETILYSFAGGQDGIIPFAGVVADAQGNLYGDTTFGGANGYGAAFELSHSGSTWTESRLFSFKYSDGAQPYGGVTLDASGNVFVPAAIGGSSGFGSLVRLAPISGGFSETVIYNFRGGTDGANPYSAVVVDSADNLYGTTKLGGALNFGTAYRMKFANGGWTENGMMSFRGGNGTYPLAGLMMSDGFLFGTTFCGGAENVGVVYQIAR